MRKAVFFDKDGIITIDKGVEKNYYEPELYPDAGKVISSLRMKNYFIFLITNQAIISRGLISIKELKAYFDVIKKMLLNQDSGAKIDKIFFCPHHPNADLEKYRVLCNCRKPKPGMLLQASNEFNISLEESYIIGDRITDIIAGKLAGCSTIQCLTGKHNDKIIETDMVIPENISPDYTVNEIRDILKIIK